MRRLVLVAAGLAALAVAGLAVAKGLDGAKSARAVAGTFTATTVTDNQTRSCTTTDGKTIAWTKGRYRGTGAGDADLAGPITFDVQSVINTTDGVGVVEGRFRIDVASGGDTVARFQGVYDHGKVAGLATGQVHEPRATLVANLSAAFSVSGGFTDGRIGNAAGGAAVELGPGTCRSAAHEEDDDDEDEDDRDKGDRRDKSVAKGTVSWQSRPVTSKRRH